jgi:hypothetical protein
MLHTMLERRGAKLPPPMRRGRRVALTVPFFVLAAAVRPTTLVADRQPTTQLTSAH